MNMSCKALELYFMNAYLNKFNLVHLDEVLLLNIMRMKRLIASE